MKGKYYAMALVCVAWLSSSVSVYAIPQESAGGKVSTVDLYLKKTDRHGSLPLPDGERDGEKEDLEKVRQDKMAAKKAAYPSLFAGGPDSGVIVIFGFRGCVWCDAQYGVIPKTYRVLKVDINKADSKGGPTWGQLMKDWKLESEDGRFVYPTTVIVKNGDPVKVFHAYKVWLTIKPHATAAEKPKEEEKKIDIDIGPFNFRFWERWKKSSRCEPKRHTAQWGRWRSRD